MSNFSYYQDSYLDKMRVLTDPLADAVVKDLFQKGFNPMVEQSYADFNYNYQKVPEAFPPILRDYFASLEHIDDSYENDLAVGSKVFQQHAPDLMAMLGALSLPYCYASGHGVQVLYLSQRIRNNPAKRLLETASFVLDVCHPTAFLPEGKGYRAIAKVRLMHAAIRFYTLKSELWNKEWGEPINQEDMAGTNLAFSLIAIRGLRKLGHKISPEKANAYIQFWNAIGLNLGIKRELLPGNNREAFSLEKQISTRGFYPTDEGKLLTRTLIDHMRAETKDQVPVESLMHYLLGKEVAGFLGVNDSGKGKSMVAFIKIMNGFKSFGSNDNAYKESLKSYQVQKEKLEKAGVELKPYRLLDNLRD